jgi:hypothetical protein
MQIGNSVSRLLKRFDVNQLSAIAKYGKLDEPEKVKKMKKDTQKRLIHMPKKTKLALTNKNRMNRISMGP